MKGAFVEKIVLFMPIASALLTMNLVTATPGSSQTVAQFRIHCMSRIMYSGNLRRSEIMENAASTACQNATTAEQSVGISNCFKDTMYNSSGRIRNGMNASTSATVCQNASNTILGQEISKCMKNSMYDARGRLRQGMTAERAVRQCSRS
ncbi:MULTISPECIES: hypothetical protein [Aerosakkonema]|uniref:hypothetical protein n=1 Tax=Aerosakkonema TaxID=1246629 RepID=UPI0035BA1A3E